MERTKYKLGLDRATLLIGFLVLLFHAVGLAGFLIPEWNARFVALVPFHLFLMFLLMLVSQKEKNTSFFVFLIVVYLAGFGIEYFGVHTGLIFGSYRYGETLGFQVAQIPLMIGINWILLIYCAGISVHYSKIKNSWLQSASAAAILVFLDILIEPVAVKFNYWTWANNTIPLQNYFAWFLFSFLCLRIFYFLKFDKKNAAAVVLLIAQFLFFISLNL